MKKKFVLLNLFIFFFNFKTLFAMKESYSVRVKILNDVTDDVNFNNSKHSSQKSSQLQEKNYPLHQAAQSGNNDFIFTLLNKGYLVDARDEHKRTPLYHAAMFRKLHTIYFLLSNGANPENIYPDIEKHLIKPGYELASQMLNLARENKLNEQKYQEIINVNLWKIAKDGKQEELLMYLNKNNVNTLNFEGKTPLYYAILADRDQIVEKLLALGADSSKIENDPEITKHLADLTKNKRRKNKIKALLGITKEPVPNIVKSNAQPISVKNQPIKKENPPKNTESSIRKKLNPIKFEKTGLKRSKFATSFKSQKNAEKKDPAQKTSFFSTKNKTSIKIGVFLACTLATFLIYKKIFQTNKEKTR